MNNYRVPVWTRTLTEEDDSCTDAACDERPFARVGEWPYCRDHFRQAAVAQLTVSKVLGRLRSVGA